MRFIALLAAAALFPLSVLAAGKADPAAQEKAREFARLSGELQAQFAAKRYAEAADVCRKMAELVPRASEPQYNLACALAHLGKKEDALAALAKAAELGFSEAALAEKDDDLVPLRSEPRYRDALARIQANDAAAIEKGEDIPGVKTVEGAPEGGLRFRLRMAPTAAAASPNRLMIWMHPSGGSMDAIVERLAPRFIQRGFALLVFTRKSYLGWSGEDVARLAKTLDTVAKIEGISDAGPVLMGFSAGGQMALELWSHGGAGLGGMVLDAAYPVRQGPDRKVLPMPLPQSEATRKVPMFVLVGTADGGSQLWRSLEPQYRQGGVPLTIRYLEGRRHEWLFGEAELGALDGWLGELAPAPTQSAGWRPTLAGGKE